MREEEDSKTSAKVFIIQSPYSFESSITSSNMCHQVLPNTLRRSFTRVQLLVDQLNRINEISRCIQDARPLLKLRPPLFPRPRKYSCGRFMHTSVTFRRSSFIFVYRGIRSGSASAAWTFTRAGAELSASTSAAFSVARASPRKKTHP